jgi:hypothetical protein
VLNSTVEGGIEEVIIDSSGFPSLFCRSHVLPLSHDPVKVHLHFDLAKHSSHWIPVGKVVVVVVEVVVLVDVVEGAVVLVVVEVVDDVVEVVVEVVVGPGGWVVVVVVVGLVETCCDLQLEDVPSQKALK